MNERIIGFARVSTDLQTNNSQIEKITMFSQEHGMNVDKVFSVTGSSESAKEVLDAALEYLDNTGIKKMIVVNASRISRTKEETERIEERFSSRGKEILYIDQQGRVDSSVNI